jgi:hypothetical protein
MKLLNKNIIKNILIAGLGFYFIISPILFKVILIRLPRDIQEIPLILILASLVIYSYLVLNLLKSYFLQNENRLSTLIKAYVSLPLQHFYISSMIYIDDYIKHTLLGQKYVGENLLKITQHLNKRLTEKTCTIIFIFLDIVPRVVFLFLFFVDVVIYQRLGYIYYFGFLTLIPLIYRYLIYTFKGFALHNIKDFLVSVYLFVMKPMLK